MTKGNQKTHISAKKSLGQNFLVDEDVMEAILEGAALTEEDLVIEIGPGRGALTRGAARRARRLIAIELDERLLPSLAKMFEGQPHVTILHRDILKTDLHSLIREARAEDPGIRQVKIIGNLPYYITTPILMHILKEGVPVDSLTVMMQQEVAERLEASPGTKAYGALSVAVGYYGTVTPILQVPRTCFRPVPKVDSQVVRLDVREVPRVRPKEESMFFACIQAAFSMRRKTLQNCFTGMQGMTKEEAADSLRQAGIDPTRRGETLTIEEFAALSDTLTNRRS